MAKFVLITAICLAAGATMLACYRQAPRTGGHASSIAALELD